MSLSNIPYKNLSFFSVRINTSSNNILEITCHVWKKSTDFLPNISSGSSLFVDFVLAFACPSNPVCSHYNLIGFLV